MAFAQVRIVVRSHGVESFCARAAALAQQAKTPLAPIGDLRARLAAVFAPSRQIARSIDGSLMVHVRPRMSAERFVESLRAG